MQKPNPFSSPSCPTASFSRPASAPGKAWANTASVSYAGGPALLNNGGYSTTLQSSAVDFTINLSGLIVGKDYIIQFVLADNRGDKGYATILAKGADVTGDSSRIRYSYTDGRFAVITASFTASATNALSQPGQRWADNVPDQTFVSGVQVLAVLEPGAALLSGLGVLCLLRRRR